MARPAPARRRLARAALALIAPATALCVGLSALAAAPAAHAADSDRGLFGAQDPTYDGVFRQGNAIYGLAQAGVRVPRASVEWLLRQQCDDGAFEAYRADPSAACRPGNPTAFSGKDTNSTAAAALALAAVGEAAPARRAARWLGRQQTASGGWEWIAGLGPDSISTGLALAALRGVDGVRLSGRAAASARAFLRSVQLRCAAPAGQRGGIIFQPGAGTSGDPLSTAQALWGLQDRRGNGGPLSCRDRHAADTVDTGRAAQRWVLRQLAAHGGTLPDVYSPGSPNWTATALAVVALAGRGVRQAAYARTIRLLQRNVDAYAGGSQGDIPGALGTLLMVSAATGARFPGVADRLLATARP